jgi:hypothetical protein
MSGYLAVQGDRPASVGEAPTYPVVATQLDKTTFPTSNSESSLAQRRPLFMINQSIRALPRDFLAEIIEDSNGIKKTQDSLSWLFVQ